MNTMNYSQMVAAQNSVYDWLYEIEDAETLLRCAWDRFFGEGTTGHLDTGELLELGTLLRVCCDRIYGAALAGRMSIGEDAPGAAAFFEQAADYREARELDKLASAAWEIERQMPPGADRENFAAARRAACDRPPAAGNRALRGLVEGGEV